MDNILIGVSGGIAAYKIPELIRLLKAQGMGTQVVMTEAAKAFITPLTLQAISGRRVLDNLFDHASEAAMGHIEWARWATKIVVAPATAHVIAKLAHGMADDLLTTLCLASEAPLWLAPAMNRQMWEHPATQANIALLKSRGVEVIGPGLGEQACGEWGLGRMIEPSTIAEILSHNKAQSLKGKRVLITLGPTREPCDPVRFLSNRSSGRMGLALISEALALGAELKVIAGPIQGHMPMGVDCVWVETAEEMYKAVMAHVAEADIFVSAAAVADYRPMHYQELKQKKGKDSVLHLDLVQNPDILKSVGALKAKPFCVGFCAETHDALAFAREKLRTKNCDIIALNEVSHPGVGFDHPTNALTVLWKEGEQFLPLADKRTIAEQLWKIIDEQYQKTCTS